MIGSEVHAQVYSTFFEFFESLSAGLRIELQLLSISEKGILHSLILTGGD